MRPASAAIVAESFPTRAAWLAARAQDSTRIGASEAAAVLGMNPYTSPWDLWRKKVDGGAGGDSDDLAADDPRARGIDWEDAVLRTYARRSGRRVLRPHEACGVQPGTVIVHRPDLDWLRVSPDAYAVDSTGSQGLVEAKTAAVQDDWTPVDGLVIDRWEAAAAELIPAQYAIQCYVQMLVTGSPWVDLCALVPERRWLQLRYVRVLADRDVMDGIAESLAAWRERHLVGREPPPIDGSSACTSFMARSFTPPRKRATRLATSAEATMIRRFHGLGAQITEMKRERELLKNQLVALCITGERLALSEEPSAPFGQTQRAGGGERIDIAMLRARYPEIARELESAAAAQSVTFRVYGLGTATEEN